MVGAGDLKVLDACREEEVSSRGQELDLQVLSARSIDPESLVYTKFS